MRWFLFLMVLCACGKAPESSCLSTIRLREGLINAIFLKVPEGLSGQEKLMAEKAIGSLYWAEQATFDLVENCNEVGTDPTIYNEYHRGKIKFPSVIEQRHKQSNHTATHPE